ncbi:MAG: Hsp70 family protein [archaeon]|nr:Hsp70 family protein [archaeon]
MLFLSSLISLIFSIFILYPQKTNSYMVGVDIGSEFFKICVIKPGKPFAIVENLQSKLKTATAMSLKDDEIIYGPDALNKKPRFPKNIFTHFENYLGVSYNDTFVKEFLSDFLVSYDIEEDPFRGTINFNINFNNEKNTVPIELIYGMLFDHIKFLSEKFAGIEITECFVTIPSFFNYKQRNALAQAIELSRFNLDGFISEPLAAAVQFQLKKTFDKKEYYIFYDMGASYTQASLVEYSTVMDVNNTKVIGNNINILGESWDKKLGGRYFDKKLINIFMNRFDNLPQRKGQQSIKTNKKIFEKMSPHAVKIKEILSANKEAYIGILGVDKGINLEGPINRDEFIESSKDLLDKIYKPIEELLKNNNMTIGNISGIELLGGSIRIPKVKETLEEKLGEYKNILGAHMNGDDSMAFGTAFMAANASSGFRGRKKTFMMNGANAELKVYLSNYNLTESMKICDEKEKKLSSDCVHKLDKNTVLIPLRYNYDNKRSVNLHHDTDIFIRVTEKMINEEEEKEIMNFTVTGITEFTKKMLAINETNQPKINLKFEYTKGGQLELTAKASYDEVLYMGRVPGPNGTETYEFLRNFSEPLNKSEIEEIDKILNTSKVITTEEILRQIEEDAKKEKRRKKKNKNSNSTETNNSTNTTDNSTETMEKEENEGSEKEENKTESLNKTEGNSTTPNKTITEHERDMLLMKKRIGEKKDNTVKKYLTVDQQFTLPRPLNYSEMSNLRKIIRKFYDIDKNRTKLIEAKNTMESLIYTYKEWLQSNQSKLFANKTEYENTEKFIKNISEWYDEDGIGASLDVLDKAIEGFHKHLAIYNKRYTIAEKRNNALHKFNLELNNTDRRVAKLLSEKKWLQEFLNETYSSKIYDIVNDINDKYKEQEKLKLYEKPVLTERYINDKINLIHKAYYNLTKIKKPEQKKDTDISMQDILGGNGSIEDLIVRIYF